MIVLVMPRRDYVPIGAKPNNWIGNGVGTTCSLVKLSSTVSAISKLLAVLAIACVTQYLTTLAANGSPQGVSSMAMQQGGLGLLMTLFLITVPPMAAAFLPGHHRAVHGVQRVWAGAGDAADAAGWVCACANASSRYGDTVVPVSKPSYFWPPRGLRSLVCLDYHSLVVDHECSLG